ncbi:MAG: STAS domain-containing protein [Clostridiales bacterium]|jgi:anti-anti-sigma factor|nr:STAS domain-containing protein [Clostridiales bacterium]
MTAHSEFSDGRMIFYINGELDESNIGEAKEAFDDGMLRGPSAVVLDLSGLTFMDSTAVGMIISRYKRLKSVGAKLYARGLTRQTERVFRTSGLFGIIEVIR